MNEPTRIAALFEEIYDGDSWIGPNLIESVGSITAATAAKKIDPWNSIWEITNHIISWRENVLQRVQGNIVDTPDNNYFEPVKDQSAKAWQKTLQELKNSQEKWVAFLAIMDEPHLEKMYPNNNASYYHNIQGILQHDAYHLGQIVLLAKKMGTK